MLMIDLQKLQESKVKVRQQVSHYTRVLTTRLENEEQKEDQKLGFRAVS